MKVFDTVNIRNVAFAGHTGGGKTSLVEAILWRFKKSDRLGNVTDGNSVSDYDPEEAKRNHSINATLLSLDLKSIKLNLLDLPGRRDFVGEIKNCLRAVEGMVLVVDGTGNIDAGAEFAERYAKEFGTKGRAVFVNKLDKERGDMDRVVGLLHDHLGMRAVPVVLPVGKEGDFKGVVDLIKMKYAEEEGQKVAWTDIPAEVADAARDARAVLVEAAAEGDDELTMKFLEDEPLSDEEVIRGLKEAMIEGRIVPVVGGAATKSLGVASLMNLIEDCFPNPAEGAGIDAVQEGEDAAEPFMVTPEGELLLYVFKTVSDPFAGHLNFFKVMRGTLTTDTTLTNLNQSKHQRLAHLLAVTGKKHVEAEGMAAGDLGAVAKLDATHTYDTLSADAQEKTHFTPTPLPQPVVRMAVEAVNKADEDKIGTGFHKLTDQDPTLHVRRDPEVHQTILSGMGTTQLDVAASRLRDNSKVEVELTPPKVPYRETITAKAEGQGKYKKQSGGRGQYGDCWIRLEPLPEGSGFVFDWAIVGGSIPTKFQPAVEKGLIEAMEKGILAGSPTVDLKATCYDGSYHDVDSSEMAFKVAASMAFKNLTEKARPIILEPIYKVKVNVPDENMGDIMGDMSGRRGRVIGTEAGNGRQIIEAQAPLAELATYNRDLRSMTRDRGEFEMEFDHYERVPGDVQEKIVAAASKANGEAGH